MATTKVDVAKIQSAIDTLRALMSAFDPANPEDVKVRVAVFISQLSDSGLIKATSDDGDEMNLVTAVKALKPKKAIAMLLKISAFDLDIAGYGREPEDAEMDEAQELLGEFGPALIDDLTNLKDAWAKKQA